VCTQRVDTRPTSSSGPISFRPTDEVRAQLHRLARSRGETVSAALKALIAERLPELAREDELIAAIDENWRKLTIAMSHSEAGPLPVVVEVEPRTSDAPRLEDVAVVEARRRGDRVAVELVGRGEHAGARILLLVAPAGRSVRFEVIPSELTPAMAS
jgi:predicted transcriptional regulator